MNLIKMTLRDVRLLRDQLDVMIVAGGDLERMEHDEDAELSFRLEPGKYVTITLPFRMPAIGEGASEADDLVLVDWQPDDPPVFVRGGSSEVRAIRAGEAAEDTDSDAPSADAVAEYVTGPLSEAEKATIRELFEAGVAPVLIAQRLRRRAQVVSLFVARFSAQSRGATGLPWTEEEVARAKDLLRQGKPASAIADDLGRPRPGTEQKLKALRKEMLAEEAARATPEAGNSPDPAEPKVSAKAVAAPVPSPVVAPVAAPAPAKPDPAPVAAPAPIEERVIRPAWWQEIEDLLKSIGSKGGWTPAMDLELVEALTRGGVQWPVLADQLGVEIGAARARFIALTPDGATAERQARLIQVLRAKVDAARPVQG